VLTDIPTGAVCYLDATIFYYHLVGAPALSDDCSDLLNLPRPKGRGFQTPSRDGSRGRFPPRTDVCIATPPVAPDLSLPTGLRSLGDQGHPDTPRPGGTPRGTFAGRLTACTALVETSDAKGYNHTLRLTQPVRQQMKQRQGSTSLFVPCTTTFCWLRQHVELARWANSGLTPWLKRGGCAAGLLKRIELGRVHGVTSSVALAEATHKVMLAEVVHRHGVAYQGLIARLKHHPELLGGLTSHHRVVATVRGLRLHVKAITLELLARGADLSTQERLLTNDALTLAVMEHLGVTVLATNDDDFDAVTGITVYKPLRA
jgi:predicted nucleic acid-binding protein